jgi:dTMP kinase
MPLTMKGFFLTVEGIEGSGKTTHVHRLAKLLRAHGQNCVVTKEPGGTPIGDRVRAILLDPEAEGMDPAVELFLLAASRRQHVIDVIQPALEAGATVLCDRFADASIAYQGFGRALELQRIRDLNDWATSGIYPDLTVIFDLGEAEGLERARRRNAKENLHAESRLEGEDLAFHRRVREGYLAIAKEDPRRFAIVDATAGVDEVFERFRAVLEERAPKLKLSDAQGA